MSVEFDRRDIGGCKQNVDGVNVLFPVHGGKIARVPTEFSAK